MRPSPLSEARMIRDIGMLCLLAFAFVALSPSAAFAGSTVGSILCTIYTQMQGQAGKAIATLAVASLGISALVGKVSWGMAIMVAVGIGVLFSANTLVNSFTGGGGC